MTFQFGGEYYNNPTSSYFIDFIKIIIPFLGGFLLTRGYDWWQNKRKRKKSVKDLISEIHLLEQPIKLQIEAINALLVHLGEKEKYTVPDFSKSILLEIERLKLLDRFLIIDYLESYFNDREQALDRTNRIFASLGVIQMQVTEIQETYFEYKSRGDVFFDKFQYNIDELIKVFTECLVNVERTGKNPNEDTFIMSIMPIFLKLKQDNERDIFKIAKNYIQAIYLKNAEMYIDPRSSKLYNILIVCNTSIRDFKALREEMEVRFENHKEQLNKHFAKVKELIADLTIT